jgi:DNA-binding winged helix-turn-helix (wHTH) protein
MANKLALIISSNLKLIEKLSALLFIERIDLVSASDLYEAKKYTGDVVIDIIIDESYDKTVIDQFQTSIPVIEVYRSENEKSLNFNDFISRIVTTVYKSRECEKLENKFTSINVELFHKERSIKIYDKVINFTKKEYELLLILMQFPNKVFSRENLLFLIWKENYLGDFRTVDKHIKKIRKKFQACGIMQNPIVTIWGLGYRLNLDKFL